MGSLRLMRPANIVTAIADILAGLAIASAYYGTFDDLFSPLLLILATIGLYGGGVVFNDVFDADLDRKERPERPIPRGIVTEKEGGILGIVLLAGGITAACFVSLYPSGLLAICIALLALVYDRWGKHHPLFGPVNMGACRGLNLLLGISLVPQALYQHFYVFIVPLIYIAAITMISRGEVEGGKSSTLITAAILYGIVMSIVLWISFLQGTIRYTLLFILLFAYMIFMPLVTAMQQPAGKNIGKAVKAGVLALILMNAAWAASFGNYFFALIILLLLPCSLLLARIFAVT